MEIPEVNPGERLERCEAWFAALGVDIRHGGERAFYAPVDDYIRMPPFASFRSPEAYYATLAHECCHLTGAKHRLDRDMLKRDEASVAREELVAELGSAFLCADLGLSPEPREDHAPYIASWLKALDDDPRAVAHRGDPGAAGGRFPARDARLASRGGRVSECGTSVTPTTLSPLGGGPVAATGSPTFRIPPGKTFAPEQRIRAGCGQRRCHQRLCCSGWDHPFWYRDRYTSAIQAGKYRREEPCLESTESSWGYCSSCRFKRRSSISS